MQKAEKPQESQLTLFSNALVICEEAEQVVLDGGSKSHLILWEKNIRWQNTGLKYTVLTLTFQSFLKCLIAEISGNKHLLV